MAKNLFTCYSHDISRLGQAKEYNEGLEDKLKFVTDSALSMEDRAQRIEEMLKEQEKTVKVST